jgi:hypothetical protein
MQLKFEFPEPKDRAAHQLVVAGVEKERCAGFSICAGAINGLLVWIEKPTAEDCEVAKCGPKKKKFGLDM